MMTYSGDQPFTLIQVSKSQTASVADVLSVIKDGASFTSDEAGFVWANETTEFYIASDSLTPEEKEAIAISVEWVDNKEKDPRNIEVIEKIGRKEVRRCSTEMHKSSLI